MRISLAYIVLHMRDRKKTVIHHPWVGDVVTIDVGTERGWTSEVTVLD